MRFSPRPSARSRYPKAPPGGRAAKAAAAAEPWSGRRAEGSRGVGGWGRARARSPAWRFPAPGDAAPGARDLSRRAAAPRSTCDRAAFVYGGPAFGRSTGPPRPGEGGPGGGTAAGAGAGAANLASRLRRGPGVTGAPPRHGRQGLSQGRPARARAGGSPGECARRAAGTGERAAGPGRSERRRGGAKGGGGGGRDATTSPVAGEAARPSGRVPGWGRPNPPSPR